MSVYEVITDLGSPIAALIAAGGAIYVTWTVGHKQVTIADQQALTAKNKLKLDLFDRRISAFDEIEKLYLYAVERRYNTKIPDSNLNEMTTKIEGYYFLFPPTNFEEIVKVRQLSRDLISITQSFQNHLTITPEQRSLQEDAVMDLELHFEQMRTNLRKAIGLNFN